MRDEMTKVQNKSYFNGWLTKLCEEFSEVPSGDKTTIRRTQIMDLICKTVGLIKDEKENPEIYKILYNDKNNICKEISKQKDDNNYDKKYEVSNNFNTDILHRNFVYNTILLRDEIMMQPLKIGELCTNGKYQIDYRITCDKKEYRKVFDACKTSELYLDFFSKIISIINESSLVKKHGRITKLFYLGSLKGEFDGLNYKDNENKIISHMFLTKFLDKNTTVFVIEENIKTGKMIVNAYKDEYFIGYFYKITDSTLFHSLLLDIFCNQF